MNIFLYVICFLLSWVSVHHFVSQLSRRYRRLPPGPTPLPIIGNLLNLGAKPHIALAHLAKIHGPVMCLKLGSRTTVVITSPSSAKEILQEYDVYFANMRTIPDSVHACNHSKMSLAWLPLDRMGRELRKIANTEMFTTNRLDARSHVLKEKVNDLMSHVEACRQAGVPVHIAQAVFTTSLNLLSSTFFSTDLAKHQLTTESGAEEETSNDKSLSGRRGGEVDGWELRRLIDQQMEESGKSNLSDFFPFLKWFDPQGRRRSMASTYSKVLDLFKEMIQKRMEIGIGSAGDVLDSFLKMSQEKIYGFDREFIPHMLLDLYVGATDTTPATIEWAMSELLHHPTELESVKKELEEVIGIGNQVEEAHVMKLLYLQAVIKETLRLHPPVPFLIPRKTPFDISISGFVIPKDSQILVNAWAIQKDPDVWEDAYAFNPHRFIESDIDFRGQDFKYIPFSSGRRTCPGMPLAIRFLPMVLASLIHSFDWKLEDGVTSENLDMEEKSGFTLHKDQRLRVIPECKS